MAPTKSLVDTFYENTVMGTFPRNTHYWPKEVVHRLVQAATVRREFDNSHLEYSQDLVEFIVRRAPMLFAISVVAETDAKKWLMAMKFFQRKGYCDKNLSVELDNRTSDSNQMTRSHLSAEDLTSDGQSPWTASFRMKVVREQWHILIPTLSTTRTNYDFKANTILPFTNMNGGNLGGAFSKVYKIQIQPGYFEDPERGVSWFLFTCRQDILSPSPALSLRNHQIFYEI